MATRLTELRTLSRIATLTSPDCVFIGPEKSLPCSFLNWSLIFQRAST